MRMTRRQLIRIVRDHLPAYIRSIRILRHEWYRNALYRAERDGAVSRN